MKLPSDIVDGLVVAEYSLSDGDTDFAHQALHVEVFEDTADDSVCKEVSGGKREHETRGDCCESVVEVGGVLRPDD